MKIKIENLVPNNYNPRKEIRSASLEELRDSIKNYGLIEPLVVRSLGDSQYEIVCGMRRYTALKDLDIDEIDCIVKDLDDIQALDIAFMENIQRENLNPIEEAIALSLRIKSMILSEYGKNANLLPYQEEIQEKIAHICALSNKSIYVQKVAELYSLSPSAISQKLSLLSLPEEVQNAIENEALPLSIGYEISRLGQLKNIDIAKELMLEAYKNYSEEKEKPTLQELKKKIFQRVKHYKEKEEKQEELEKQQIETLKKQITETEKKVSSKRVILKNQVEEIRNHEAFKDFEYDYDKNNLIEFSKNLIELLEQENERYQDNDFYDNCIIQIGELENHLSDIHLLQNRVQKENIRICPYCYAKIDLSAIRKKEDIYNENLVMLKVQKRQITEIAEFINSKIVKIRDLILTIESMIKTIERNNIKIIKIEEENH